MSMAGDSAEQVEKIVLDGVEVGVNIVGDNMRELTKLILEELRYGQPSPGKTSLRNLIKQNVPMQTFELSQKNLEKFAKAAKEYGVQYHVLKSRADERGRCFILVKKNDASQVNHILSRYNLSLKSDVDIANNITEEKTPARTEKEADKFLDALFSKEKQDISYSANPTKARAEKSRPSELSSDRSNMSRNRNGRVSVRDEFNKYKAMNERSAPSAPVKGARTNGRNR